jgi:energy-coupling factor transport system ATP-binding protein
MSISVTIAGGKIVFRSGRRLNIQLSPTETHIDSGTIVVLQGDNGSGKSSYLKAISGVYDSFFDADKRPETAISPAWQNGGTSISVNPRVTRSSVNGSAVRAGYLAQSPRANVFCHSVEDELAFSLEHSSMPFNKVTQRLSTALEELNTFGIAGTTEPHALSKGQQQILGFKSLIQTDPELLFLDEPSAVLDNIAANWLVEKLHDLLHCGRLQIVFIASQDSRLLSCLEKHKKVKVVRVGGYIDEIAKLPAIDIEENGHLKPEIFSLKGVRSSWNEFSVELPDTKLQPGDAIIIYGRNGTGKSTLLETIVGFKKAESGVLQWGNVRLRVGRSTNTSLLCYAFQNAEEQITFFRGDQEIQYPPKRKGWMAGCQEFVNKSGIDLSIPPWHLSYGQRKLLTYYSFVFGGPILMVDEPFTSLDGSHRLDFVKAVNNFLSVGGIFIGTASRKHEEFDKIHPLKYVEI